MNKDYHAKGSHDYRARIFAEIEPEISAIDSKEEAAAVIFDNQDGLFRREMMGE
jgi:nanoRNase/pAp phosphatase (c-di-AMP/oligoRNAs hydrolase)